LLSILVYGLKPALHWLEQSHCL